MAIQRASSDDSRQLTEFALVGAALVASIVLVLAVTGSASLALVYGCGLLVLGLAAFTAARQRPTPAHDHEAAEPDWSVTVAAIEQPELAVAITDRANRLVCANEAFEREFGSSNAPPRLQVSAESADLLARIARSAWRDGSGGEALTITDGERIWTVQAQRAGPADNYLVWRFSLVRREEPVSAIAGQLGGALGRMLGNAGIGAAIVERDGTIRTASPAFARCATGEETARLAGQDFASLLRTDEHDRIFFAHDGAKGAPQVLVDVPLEDTGPGEDAVRLMLVLDSSLGVGAWNGDAGKQAPQLEALIERLPLGLAAIDRDGRFMYANPSFRRAAGVASKGMPPYPSDLVARADKTALADAVRRFGHGPAAAGDITVRLVSQPDEPVSLGLTGVRGLGEVAVLLSLADMTEENRLKRQVAQATKMQAVGQLAGGVAHDFNNVLTAIIGYCDLMLLRHSPGDSDYDDIQQIKANSNRAASLTRQLLAFSRQQTLKPEIIQLPDVLSEVSQLLKRLLGARITLEVHHDRNLGAVRADPRQLEQVIVNLAVNARDAIQAHGGGEQAVGTLSFATRRVAADDIRRMDSEIIPPGDYTVLIAEDTGGGIPRRVLGKIFEPFFTTKEQGKGTGLGLSTVYGIVKQSGGFIFADNVREADGTVRGARFTVYLPVHAAGQGEQPTRHAPEEIAAERQDGTPESEPRKEGARDWSGGGRILLVEDEDMVRAVAERALTRAGYDVVTARDGEEGLEAFATGGAFDLVISDVVMPSVDGPTMARAIRKAAPDLPVLFMSGYAEAQLRDEIDIAAMHFIAKPFSVRQIADKAGTILAARGEQG